MKNPFHTKYNRQVREQRQREREVQTANAFQQNLVQKSGQNARTGVNKGYTHYEEKVKPKEKPEREINQSHNLNLKELKDELRNKESEPNNLKYKQKLIGVYERGQQKTTKQYKQKEQSRKEPDNELNDPTISSLKDKIQQLDDDIKKLQNAKYSSYKTNYTNQINEAQKEKKYYEQRLNNYISEKEKKKTSEHSSNVQELENQPKQLNQHKLKQEVKQNVLSFNKTDQPYNPISKMENTKKQLQENIKQPAIIEDKIVNQSLKISKKQSNKTINQNIRPIEEDKPKKQPSDEPEVQKLFRNDKQTETPNKHSSNFHKQSSKKIQKFEYEDNNEDDNDEDLVNNEEFITDKPKYNPVFNYEYIESSQKLLVNIFLPGNSENIQIKEYKIMQSETDKPKMACFIKGTYECDENTEVFKDGEFILCFDLPESITSKSKEQKLNGKVRDQKGNDTGFYEVEFLF